MSCIPRSGGCERPSIEPFVQFLNRDEGVNFQHISCLDVWNRKEPQPEILYGDSDSGTWLVIERKAVVWPPDFTKKHRAYHTLIDSISEHLEEFCINRAITVELPSPRVSGKKQIIAMARTIADTIRSSAARIDHGCEFTFKVGAGTCRVYPGAEIDIYGTMAPSGIMFRFDINPPQPERPPADNLPVKLQKELEKIFSACAKKFSRFADARRILSLNPCGDAFWLSDAEWWQDVLQVHRPDRSIDEIWLVYETEDATGEPFWNFDMLYPKEAVGSERRSGLWEIVA